MSGSKLNNNTHNNTTSICQQQQIKQKKIKTKKGKNTIQYKIQVGSVAQW